VDRDALAKTVPCLEELAVRRAVGALYACVVVKWQLLRVEARFIPERGWWGCDIISGGRIACRLALLVAQVQSLKESFLDTTKSEIQQ